MEENEKKTSAGAQAEKREFLSGIKKTEKLIPCFTIVVYFGEEPWDGPESLKDMLELDTLPVQIRDQVADYPMKLLEVRKYRNWDDFQTDIKYVFGVLQKTASSKGLKLYVEENSEQFENLEEDAYDVISMMSHSKELEVIKEHHRTETGGINMCKAIKELIAEGVNQGIERGIDDGIVLMKAVLRLHVQGFSEAQIAKKCNISVEKVKYILDDSVA